MQTGEQLNKKISLHGREVVPGSEFISQTYDLNSIFVGNSIDGQDELLIFLKKNSNGGIMAYSLNDGKKKTVYLKKDLRFLSNFGLKGKDAKPWAVASCLDALAVRHNCEEIDTEDRLITISENMKTMFPNHLSAESFQKDALKIISWYNILINAYNRQKQ